MEDKNHVCTSTDINPDDAEKCAGIAESEVQEKQYTDKCVYCEFYKNNCPFL